MRIAISITFLTLISLSSGVIADVGKPKFEYIGKFDSSQIPYISDEFKENIAKIHAEFKTGKFTLAVSENGLFGWKSWKYISAKDHIRTALQRCEHVAQQPCGIVAHKNKLVKFYPFPRQLIYTDKFDANQVPFVSTKSRSEIRRGYYQRGSWNMALVLTSGGGWQWNDVDKSQPEEKAVEKAIANCQDRNPNNFCFVFAINQRVVFGPDTPIDP